MANVILPTVIQGPAYLLIGGQVIYVEKDIAVNEQAESWNPGSAFGPMGERHKSRKDVLTLKPAGQIKTVHLDYYYAAFLTPTVIGTTILAGAVAIASVAENKTYTWRRGGMSKPPGLILKPTATAFGGMEVTCIGMNAVQPTGANFWRAAEAAVAGDTSFEETTVISDIYKAALGSRATPYDGMGGMDGFEVDFGFMCHEVPSSDVGIADIILGGLSTGAKFAPSNLTEAQNDVLLAKQDTTATLPGQAYGRAAESLVITGTQIGWIFTVKSLGAKSGSRTYQIGEHRFKELNFVNNRTWTTGAPDALFAYTAPS